MYLDVLPLTFSTHRGEWLRVIPFHKAAGGIRPLVVGETFRRLIAKKAEQLHNFHQQLIRLQFPQGSVLLLRLKRLRIYYESFLLTP